MRCKPPRRFRPAGTISWAEAVTEGPSFCNKRPRHRGARAKGIRYEERVHAKMDSLYKESYLAAQWFRFGTNGSDVRWCQPDGLLFDVRKGVIVVAEVKYNHTTDAWWQLRHLYGPLIQFLFPTFQIHLLEICQWYDCALTFPEEVSLTPAADRTIEGAYNLHIYRPKRSDP